MQNQNIIRELGLDWFMEQQSQRMSILRTMLGYYNDGRSKTFYCLAATLLTLNSLNEALKEVEAEVKDNSISETDLKSKAKLLRSILNKYAEEENEDLKMRKKK